MKKMANSGILFVSVCVLLALAGPAWAIDDSNLVSHWKFDEGGGDTAYDSAGSNDGTIYGAQWADGIIDGALDFDGVDDYVGVGDIGVTGDWTVGFWAKLDTVAPDIQYPIGTGPGGIGGAGIFMAFSKWQAGRWGIHDGVGYHTYHVGSVVSAGVWYHAAVTKSGTTYTLYLNGNFENDGSLADIDISDLQIGRRSDNWWYVDGLIDEVHIYDRALSAEEVLALYKEETISVGFDIKPGSCPNPLNLASRGLLPAAILGSQDFDVTTIDIASIRLAGVAPIRSNYEDVATPVADGNECECTAEGPDGYTDLTLKFKTQEIVEKFINAHSELVGGQTLSLTLTGALSDDTLIEGTDCVLLVGNVPRAIAAKRADINGDGVVDFRDLTIVANYWLESSEIE